MEAAGGWLRRDVTSACETSARFPGQEVRKQSPPGALRNHNPRRRCEKPCKGRKNDGTHTSLIILSPLKQFAATSSSFPASLAGEPQRHRQTQTRCPEQSVLRLIEIESF
jgi:hypothetical protein